MDKELIFVVGFFWLVSALYVMYYHNKHYKINVEMIIGAILLGPLLALIMKNPEEESTVAKNIDEHIKNDKHRRQFQLNDRISRGRMHSNWFRTIPPPPPISQPPNRRPEIKKDFKFFRG